MQLIRKRGTVVITENVLIFNTHNGNIYLPKMKKMIDSAKTLVLLRKHSILNVYERGSVYQYHNRKKLKFLCHEDIS